MKEEMEEGIGMHRRSDGTGGIREEKWGQGREERKDSKGNIKSEAFYIELANIEKK